MVEGRIHRATCDMKQRRMSFTQVQAETGRVDKMVISLFSREYPETQQRSSKIRRDNKTPRTKGSSWKSAHRDCPDYWKSLNLARPQAPGHDRLGAEVKSLKEATGQEAHHREKCLFCQIIRLVVETGRPKTHLRRESGQLIYVTSMRTINTPTAWCTNHRSTTVTSQRPSRSEKRDYGRRFDPTCSTHSISYISPASSYVTLNVIADTDAALMHYMQPPTVSKTQYAKALIAKSHGCGEEYGEFLLKVIFIESSTNQSNIHSMWPYWSTHLSSILYDLTRHARSLRALYRLKDVSPRESSSIVEIRNNSVVVEKNLETRSSLWKREGVPQQLRQRRRTMLQRWCKSNPTRNRHRCRLHRIETKLVRLPSIPPLPVVCVLRSHIVRHISSLVSISCDNHSPQNAIITWRTCHLNRGRGLDTRRQARRNEDRKKCPHYKRSCRARNVSLRHRWTINQKRLRRGRSGRLATELIPVRTEHSSYQNVRRPRKLRNRKISGDTCRMT